MAKAFDLKRVLEPVQDIVRKLQKRRDELLEEANEIDGHIQSMGGKKRGRKNAAANGENGESAVTTKRGGKRKRRSREQLMEMAGQVVELIKSKGKEGASAKDLQTKFGPLVPSVNAWLKLYSPVKVKTTGAKSKMRYFA